ncbi:MAG TPA: hypothetical protein VLS28_05850 [Candidatus Sulfomarinibacteraceae bacterium]|nr:hypothetical protein [Candidatus Sulfomarinibacteraceae bacterium]
MAMVLLVARPSAGQPVLGPEAAQRLATLGISRIALLADDAGIGVVLEGWAFDPARVDDAVMSVFPAGSGTDVRVLHDVEFVAVTPAPNRRSGR